ncbi:MAG: hypothetical protein EOR46_21590 [Mesorhizobium sp.]|nr:MAG: hypothetical protein EOR46_21590 [Mesorhizobium sp.]RWK66537.1 MAG: hypothetical protein EOR54_24020 [Mesorhizobium sp.]RWK73396.1 MAG: hypothetical protein EOR50_23825 [Mesorhizobium sp.]RWK77217.1 MAG: hypothetical protein EOR51_26745 [Mesorhizobium sp.]RWL00268.1 MAG: hypothetical protein EOR55_29530 [Mesorhizobium sp.]
MPTPRRLSGRPSQRGCSGSARDDPNAWAGLKLVRTAIEQTCPAGVLPSEEAVLLLYGLEPVHEGEALAKPLSR